MSSDHYEHTATKNQNSYMNNTYTHSLNIANGVLCELTVTCHTSSTE